MHGVFWSPTAALKSMCDVGLVELVIRVQLSLSLRYLGDSNVSSSAALLHHVGVACVLDGSSLMSPRDAYPVPFLVALHHGWQRSEGVHGVVTFTMMCEVERKRAKTLRSSSKMANTIKSRSRCS